MASAKDAMKVDGKKIRHYRRFVLNNRTQAEAASIGGITEKTWRSYENGVAQYPQGDTIEGLAKGLGVTVDAFRRDFMFAEPQAHTPAPLKIVPAPAAPKPDNVITAINILSKLSRKDLERVGSHLSIDVARAITYGSMSVIPGGGAAPAEAARESEPDRGESD